MFQFALKGLKDCLKQEPDYISVKFTGIDKKIIDYKTQDEKAARSIENFITRSYKE